MEAFYPLALIIHIFCAIIFVGYLFFDVVIFSKVKKSLSKDCNDIENSISKKAIKIMPICVFLLLFSGGFMMSRWVNSDLGYFNELYQKVFMIKVICACLIFLAVIFSLFCKFMKIKNPISSIIHPLALILATIIVICAKLMFYV
ncbi:copper resistance protein CopD [Campylobacter sp. MG1]|uniref:copper resistance protein CopD n=1 Tax=Campylobacter sp. MG1 TaxID=2976332 RepID=UPI00226C6DCE|nr:copper resistance protein CopD [Campylobacter sp. MG1]